ncbi:hypothetical protein [Jeongeupia sp. USM3]|uniref:hypothetical protein n=1 Tax=Jeongeupia sp. USM3 TaxID=1906741 RepID=UPI0011AB5F2A|nr:hypothetical protein [Jeongeupia sp. USM3]
MSEKIVVALIEHAIRPVVYLVLGAAFISWLFYVKEPLLDVVGSGDTTVRAGSFEVSLRAKASAGDLSDELAALQMLNDTQLQLFLVIGKERGPIQYHGEEVSEENLNRLKEVGLLDDIRRTEQGAFQWSASEKANRLHDVIFRQVIRSIKRTNAP